VANLGNVALDAGEVAETEGYCRQALQIAIAEKNPRMDQHVLVVLANWRAYRGEREWVVELLAQALDLVTFTSWVEYPARMHLDAMRAELAPADFAATQARGFAWDAGTMLKAHLAELDKTTDNGTAPTLAGG